MMVVINLFLDIFSKEGEGSPFFNLIFPALPEFPDQPGGSTADVIRVSCFIKVKSILLLIYPIVYIRHSKRKREDRILFS